MIVHFNQTSGEQKGLLLFANQNIITAQCYAMSVCLSVTSRCFTKTDKRRITWTKPHDSPETVVFWRQRSPRYSTGGRGRQMQGKWVKIGDFRQITGYISKMVKGKDKGKRSIALRNKPHRYGNSRAIWDHTVLPATRQRWHSRRYPSRSWYSIKRPRRDARLSWPSWLVTARDGIPAPEDGHPSQL